MPDEKTEEFSQKPTVENIMSILKKNDPEEDEDGYEPEPNSAIAVIYKDTYDAGFGYGEKAGHVVVIKEDETSSHFGNHIEILGYSYKERGSCSGKKFGMKGKVVAYLFGQ